MNPERRQELLKDVEIQELIMFYCEHSVASAIQIAVKIADDNKGMLQIGDMILKEFGIKRQEKKK